MLKISIQETTESIEFIFSGRLAGPWVKELDRVWRETTPRLGKKTLILDLRELTYSDSDGKHVLSRIYAETEAELIAGSQWSQHLAEEISASQGNQNGKRTKGAASADA